MNKDDDIIDITNFDLSKKKKRKLKNKILLIILYNYDLLCDRLYNSLKRK